MEIYLESMTKLVHHVKPWMQYTVRCWRQETGYGMELEVKNLNEILEKLTTIESENKYDIAAELLKMDRMNAVEVLDMSGNGPVMYKDWP